MRYVKAASACGGIFLVWSLVTQAMGDKHLGGVVPTVVLLLLLSFVWRSVTSAKDD
jgi:hypothetical protein